MEDEELKTKIVEAVTESMKPISEYVDKVVLASKKEDTDADKGKRDDEKRFSSAAQNYISEKAANRFEGKAVGAAKEQNEESSQETGAFTGKIL